MSLIVVTVTGDRIVLPSSSFGPSSVTVVAGKALRAQSPTAPAPLIACDWDRAGVLCCPLCHSEACLDFQRARRWRLWGT